MLEVRGDGTNEGEYVCPSVYACHDYYYDAIHRASSAPLAWLIQQQQSDKGPAAQQHGGQGRCLCLGGIPRRA